MTEPGELQRIVDDVAGVQPFWAALPLSDRARYLRRTAQVILDHLDDLGTLIAREQGRPRPEALSTELLTSVDALHRIAREGPRALDDKRIGLPLLARPKRARIVHEPLGVVAVRGHWAEPWATPLREAALALMAGNGVVLAPSPLTARTGDRIRWAFERAGVPTGIVATASVSEDGGELLAGAVARVLPGTAGGKGPMLVLADADLPNAVSGALWGSFANAGQSQSGIARIYVVREAADEFLEAFVARARALRPGDPLDPETDVGPLVASVEEVRRQVDEVVGGGATLHCGGPVGEGERPLYAPTILTGVDEGAPLAREGVPGPVVTVAAIDSDEEGIARASRFPPAASASVWTRDRALGERIARLLPAERVWVNDHMHWGSGRARSRAGFHECVTVRLLGWEPSRTGSPWWFPYDESLRRALESAGRIVYGRDADKAPALRRGALPMLRLARRTLGGARGRS